MRFLQIHQGTKEQPKLGLDLFLASATGYRVVSMTKTGKREVNGGNQKLPFWVFEVRNSY